MLASVNDWGARQSAVYICIVGRSPLSHKLVGSALRRQDRAEAAAGVGAVGGVELDADEAAASLEAGEAEQAAAGRGVEEEPLHELSAPGGRASRMAGRSRGGRKE